VSVGATPQTGGFPDMHGRQRRRELAMRVHDKVHRAQITSGRRCSTGQRSHATLPTRSLASTMMLASQKWQENL